MKHVLAVLVVAVATPAVAESLPQIPSKPIYIVVKTDQGRCWAWDDQRTLKCHRPKEDETK